MCYLNCKGYYFISLTDFIDRNKFMNDLISCACYMQLSVIIEANFKFSFLCSLVYLLTTLLIEIN